MSARHPWRTLGAWGVAIVAAIVAVVMFLGDVLTGDVEVTAPTESRRADAVLVDAFPQDRTARERDVTEVVVVRAEDGSITAALPAGGSRRRRAARRGCDHRRHPGAHLARRRRPRAAARPRLRRHGRRPRALRRRAAPRRRARLRRRRDRRAHLRRGPGGALGGRPAHGRAVLRPARGAPDPPARLRHRRGGARAARARARLDRRRARARGALGQAFDLSLSRSTCSPRWAWRSGSTTRCSSSRATARSAHTAATRTTRSRPPGDGQPRRALQRPDVRARHGRPGARAELDLPQPRRRGDQRRARVGARRADAAAGGARPARRSHRRAADPGLRARRRTAGREGRFWGAIVRAVMRRPVVSLVLATAFCSPSRSRCSGSRRARRGRARCPTASSPSGATCCWPGSSPRRRPIPPRSRSIGPPTRAAGGRPRLRPSSPGTRCSAPSVEERAGETTRLTVPIAGDPVGEARPRCGPRAARDVIPRGVRGSGAEVLVTGDTAEELDFHETVDGWLLPCSPSCWG